MLDVADDGRGVARRSDTCLSICVHSSRTGADAAEPASFSSSSLRENLVLRVFLVLGLRDVIEVLVLLRLGAPVAQGARVAADEVVHRGEKSEQRERRMRGSDYLMHSSLLSKQDFNFPLEQRELARATLLRLCSARRAPGRGRGMPSSASDDTAQNNKVAA